MGVDLNMVAEVRQGDSWHALNEKFSFGRNRDAFAVLTGCFDPPPLMKPVAAFLPLRGIPNDPSPELAPVFYSIRQETSNYVLGINWLMLRELLEFPWYERRVTHIFDPDKSRPLGYLVAGAPDGTYTQTYAEFMGTEWMELILPKIRSLGSPDDVRLTYWLDR